MGVVLNFSVYVEQHSFKKILSFFKVMRYVEHYVLFRIRSQKIFYAKLPLSSGEHFFSCFA